MSQSKGTVETRDIKLFGEWSFEGVTVRDMGLQRYLRLNPIYLPHSGGRHEPRRFHKSDLNIVERLINSMMRPGSSGGEKARISSVVKSAFKIINLKTGRNPIEVLVRAVENAAPNEDTTRIGYGGVVYRLAVDISPQRRIDLALRFIIQGAKTAAFNNRKTLEELLAEQLIGAANNDQNVFAIRRKLEMERVALSSR
ncbi:MAG: 30S ribosomal protein S7 [Candidatus Bathyarchaeia archaeon]